MSNNARDHRGGPAELHDWDSIAQSLDAYGNAVLPGWLTAAQCERLTGMYGWADGYRARIVMARHGFGKGEYKYFAYPLPPLLDELRHGSIRIWYPSQIDGTNNSAMMCAIPPHLRNS